MFTSATYQHANILLEEDQSFQFATVPTQKGRNGREEAVKPVRGEQRTESKQEQERGKKQKCNRARARLVNKLQGKVYVACKELNQSCTLAK